MQKVNSKQQREELKRNIHPPYQTVTFIDASTGEEMPCGSTFSEDICKCAVTSKSHPFYVGGDQFVDSDGMIDKFRKKYGR